VLGLQTVVVVLGAVAFVGGRDGGRRGRGNVFGLRFVAGFGRGLETPQLRLQRGDKGGGGRFLGLECGKGLAQSAGFCSEVQRRPVRSVMELVEDARETLRLINSPS
jgi:hypothetical protein